MVISQRYFQFLDELATHNTSAWFNANRQRYVDDVEAPFLALLGAVSPDLATLCPHIRCDAQRSGGSMMRIHRGTRFSKDKAPFKDHMGAMLLHRAQKRGPGMMGFLLHLGPQECTLGAGVSMPDAKALAKIRTAIAAGGKRW
jgi:uncharacterized protein (TIGR02453 family)